MEFFTDARRALKIDSALWRAAARASIKYGPDSLVRHSPPVFGWFLSTTLRAQRNAIRKTLTEILGPRPASIETRQIAEVFANFASSMTDAMLAGSDRGYWPTSRPIRDWHFLSSYARGRGVILATAQTAGWDIGGSMLSNVQPKDVMVVMEAENDPHARRLHDRVRKRSGVKVVHVGKDPLSGLTLLKHLRARGGIVALKFDRVAAGMRSRAVMFLGRRWQVPEGPLSLAAVSGAPIIVVLTRRLGFLEYELINHEPIYLPRRPSEQQLSEAAQQMASALETFVKRHPTQWFRFNGV